ncbi:hypothetical protein E3N88_31346 [Mikania micrantha]|uniref:Auxin-responsive protein n=1 Tax=Mikania micrantha TaxID=192012 RepID=A0A5N6MQ08_9ASTR|nr:hypothetical protein E3N88_31346 [Mikania micrantha]
MTPKKIMKMVRKWRVEALKSGYIKRNDSKTYKGHFVVYATDKIRFVMPLRYLNNVVFLELLRMSNDEFGLPRNGPITLPCDSMLMNYLNLGFTSLPKMYALDLITNVRLTGTTTFLRWPMAALKGDTPPYSGV